MRFLSSIRVKTGVRYALGIAIIIAVIYVYYISTTPTRESAVTVPHVGLERVQIFQKPEASTGGGSQQGSLGLSPFSRVPNDTVYDNKTIINTQQADIVLYNLVTRTALVQALPVLAKTWRNEVSNYTKLIIANGVPNDDSITNIQQRFPGAIVVGQRKCGTHALKDFFNVHPQLRAGTIPVEPIFFSWRTVYSTGLEKYRRMMPYTEPRQVTIEKSPEYFESAMAVSKMRKDLKNVKILIALRDPVERVFSDFIQEIKLAEVMHRKAPWGYDDFEKVIIRPDGRLNDRSKIIQGSKYVTHVARWVTAFGAKNVHFIDGDILIKNPLLEMKKIEKFLGVDEVYDEDTFVYDHEKGFMCIAKPYYYCLPDSKGRPHPVVKNETKKKLYDHLKPFTEELFKKYHRFDWPVYN